MGTTCCAIVRVLSTAEKPSQVCEAALLPGAVCWLCGRPFDDPADPPVADHVIPRAHGGADDLSNLRPAHKTCNGRRNQARAEGWQV